MLFVCLFLERFVDLTDEGEIETDVSELRSQLRNEVVPSHLDESCISEHAIHWTEKGVDQDDPDHAAYLKTFCDKFIAKMMQMIDRCMQDRPVVSSSRQDALHKEVLAHLRFCQEKCQHFCGRENELYQIQSLLDETQTTPQDLKEKAEEAEEKIEDYQENEVLQDSSNGNEMQRLLDTCKITGATFCYGDTFDDYESDPTRDIQEENISLPRIEKFKKPVIIHGPPGSGKTALMARIAQLSKRWVPGSVCIVRFMGTTALSSNIRDVLVSVSAQLLQLYSLSPPTGLDLSVDFHYLVLYFNALLWRIDSRSTPLFLLLDSVDQLQPSDYAHLFTWLPKIVPPNVHLFVSLASDHPTCLESAQERVSSEEHFIQLRGLDQGTADKVVRSVCHRSGRTLTASQRGVVLQTFAHSGQVRVLSI